MIEVLPWDFIRNGGITYPADPALHESAMEFCKQYLTDKFDPRPMQKLWVVRRAGKVLGASAVTSRVDIPMFRSIDEEATYALGSRMVGWGQDNGLRGQAAFLFLSEHEKVEKRCANREQVLKMFGAVPAERYVIIVP